MKQHFVNSCVKLINKYYDYNDEKINEIKYGLATVYITFTKTVVIFALTFILGIFKEMIVLLILYNLLRLTGFGLHAKESWQCWLSSIVSFIILPVMIRYFTINIYVKIALMAVCILFIFIYAPADTEKRPIVSKNRRLIYKSCCTLSAILYLILIIFINDNMISNSLLFATILETVLILPTTYKIFKLKYDNYKSYKKA
ncbi:MAG: accessory gene regulator B family protein [Bacilli bacterium]